MNNQIQFLSVTPEQLSELIGKHLANKLDELKDSIPRAEQLLTRTQTAALLDVNLSTLWSYTKSGKLLSYSLGNKIFYKRSEVESALTPLRR